MLSYVLHVACSSDAYRPIEATACMAAGITLLIRCSEATACMAAGITLLI